MDASAAPDDFKVLRTVGLLGVGGLLEGALPNEEVCVAGLLWMEDAAFEVESPIEDSGVNVHVVSGI